MAGNLSNYAENKILDHSAGRTSWSMPSVWIALYTVAPTDSTGGTEVNGGSYVRVQVANGTNSVWGAATSGTIKNDGSYNATSSGLASGTGIITFPKATASWGTVVAVALVDSANSSGSNNIIWYGTLNNAKTVDIDDTVSFAASDLQLSLD